MDKFKIELSPAASRDLDNLEIEVVTKVLSDLKILKENP
jgi:mRNA-degrading endonuclease RelE of RelBE toxin-antitoxin system